MYSEIEHGKGLGQDLGTPTVLVRAFEDEPVKLLALSFGKGAVEVASRPGGQSIFLPYGYVYNFDPVVYDALRTAYQAKDTDALLSLWRGIPHVH